MQFLVLKCEEPLECPLLAIEDGASMTEISHNMGPLGLRFDHWGTDPTSPLLEPPQLPGGRLRPSQPTWLQVYHHHHHDHL